jgi:nitrogenase molybdenum-iron protein alpha chain
MTNRGCCFAGCKGVVLGPLTDVAIITHGPIGCAFYSWGTRRHRGRTDDGKNFLEYCFSTDMQESDIVLRRHKLKRRSKRSMRFQAIMYLNCSQSRSLIGDEITRWRPDGKGYVIQCVAFRAGNKGVSSRAATISEQTD